jgi:hypothetical protein
MMANKIQSAGRLAEVAKLRYSTLRSWYAKGWLKSDTEARKKWHTYSLADALRVIVMAELVRFNIHPNTAGKIVELIAPIMTRADYSARPWFAVGFYEDGTFAVYSGQLIAGQEEASSWMLRQEILEDGSPRGVFRQFPPMEIPIRVLTLNMRNIEKRLQQELFEEE